MHRDRLVESDSDKRIIIKCVCKKKYCFCLVGTSFKRSLLHLLFFIANIRGLIFRVSGIEWRTILKSVSLKVVRLRIEAVELILLAPTFIFNPFRSPVLTFAKDFEMRNMIGLQRSCHRNMLWISWIFLGCRVGLTWSNGVVVRSNALFDQAMHLVNLPL